KGLKQREENDAQRYLKYYGFDHRDKKNYDFVIDTTNLTPEEVVARQGQLEKELNGVLVDVANETGTPHMVSVNRRFQPLICEGREWALSQGPMRFVRASMLRHNRREDFFVSGTAIHSIDALRFIAGDVAHVESFTQDADTLWFHFVLQFESGTLGALDVLTSDGCAEERYEIYGEGYRVDMAVERSREPRLRCWKDDEVVIDKIPPNGQPEFVRIGPYAETHEFITGLIEKRALWPTVADIFPSLELGYQLNP
ncbi:MAG: hypothetical protein QGG64_01065, partial [Candidatus Latescibacteria bacterium]|nr:hypothetical protein [Candidatus Latescibacterota bacterium]